MTRSNRQQSLSVQIIRSFLVVLGLGLAALVLVGNNAVTIADTEAKARQERFATRTLAAEIDGLPEQQRSATVWDDAVLRTGMRDSAWMNANLGAWMQDYFGHDESYVLDSANQPFFASIDGEILSPDTYGARADYIAPLVRQLRSDMAEVSEGLDNPYEELAGVAAVAPLRFDTGVSIVSVVPIISDSGDITQTPGTESLHVAVRYVDAEYAQQIGDPNELRDVAFTTAPPAGALTGVPVSDPSGEALAWLVWQPERPGMELLMRMLPVLLASALAIALLLWWVLHRLRRVSAQLALSEERLQQSQKLETIGQLTGGIAHDFNNLLTIIMGNTEMIQDELEPDHPLRRYADLSAVAADRAAELTSRLLAFSRKQALQPQVVDVNEVIVGFEAMLRRTLSEDIDIRINAAHGLWRTEVDLGQTETALLNLAINARDAMPDGGTLTIETANVVLNDSDVALEPGLVAGEFVMIAVRDTGHGIPKSQIDRVFEPFFTTKAVGKGTGLGLSMVYGFVKQTGGHIAITSAPGEGTTVWLYFPRQRGAGPVPEAVTGASTTPQRGRETILIVEDDNLILQQLAEQLSALDYEVLAEATGAPALAKLRERPDIALLLTDVVLPGGMNGQEIAEEARRIRPDLKVLYTSGYSRSALMHQGRLDPGVELLSKPYRRSELAEKLRKVLDGQVPA